MDDERATIGDTPKEKGRTADRARQRRLKELRKSSHDEFIEALSQMTHTKQLNVMDAWAGTEVELEDGVSITARSKKELRRFTRPKDPAMVEWIRGFEADDVFYDIGANCGSLTLAAGAMHREGIRIVAIEPGWANFESLVRNLAHNDMLGSVIPLQVALLAETGLEPMNYYRTTDAGTSLHAVGEPIDHEGNRFAPVQAQMMPTFALDDLIEILSLPMPTRVKIDVDGFEEGVLRGASRTLGAATITDLAIEIVDHDRRGTRLASVGELLGAQGYELSDTFQHQGAESFVADYLFRRQ